MASAATGSALRAPHARRPAAPRWRRSARLAGRHRPPGRTTRRARHGAPARRARRPGWPPPGRGPAFGEPGGDGRQGDREGLLDEPVLLGVGGQLAFGQRAGLPAPVEGVGQKVATGQCVGQRVSDLRGVHTADYRHLATLSFALPFARTARRRRRARGSIRRCAASCASAGNVGIGFSLGHAWGGEP